MGHTNITYANRISKKIQEASLFLINEIANTGVIYGCMGEISAISVKDTRILATDSSSLNGIGMSQPLPYAEVKFDERVILEKLLSTADSADTSCVLKVELKYTDEAKKYFWVALFVQRILKLSIFEYTDYMKSTILKPYYPTNDLNGHFSIKTIHYTQ